MDIRTRAAGYINIKMRTEAQLRKHLTDKGYSSGDISEVVDEFKQYGYIDDLNYATLYYEYAFSKGRGLFRIKRELKSKGIDQDIIEELKNLDITMLTPMDAMNTLYRLQNKLKNRW